MTARSIRCIGLIKWGKPRETEVFSVMIKILFVCHGNICRSPMAEFVMKKLAADVDLNDRFFIESAATSEEEIRNGIGNPIYPPALATLKRHGIDSTEVRAKRARRLKAADYDKYDLLIGMDYMNIKNIERMTGHTGGKIKLLMSFTGKNKEVADPWYTGDFEETWNDVVAGCTALLEELRNTL